MNPNCKRCGKPLDVSTATVNGTEGYPTSMLRTGDALCRNCDGDRAAAFPGGMVGGVPAFNKANTEHVTRSNRRGSHTQRDE